MGIYLLISSHTSDNSLTFPWKVAWFLMYSLLEEKSPNKPVNNIWMAIIFLFLSCLGRRYFYLLVIMLCKLSKSFEKYFLRPIIVPTFLFIQSLTQVPRFLHWVTSKLIFRFYKCKNGKAVALGLTSFTTRPLLGVIKLEGRRLLLFPHILEGLLSGFFLLIF